MVARTCILMSILAFTVVHIAALFKGKALDSVWLTSLGAMIIFAIVGFFLGWAFEALIKETVSQEETLLFSEYLKKNPEAGGDKSPHNLKKALETNEDEDDQLSGIEGMPPTSEEGTV